MAKKNLLPKVYSSVKQEIEQLRLEIQSYRFVSNYLGYVVTKLLEKDFCNGDENRDKALKIARSLLLKYKVNADFNINQLKQIKNDLLRAIGD